MDKEKLIKKWLNNELTVDEQSSFDAMEDATFLKEITQEAKRFGGAQTAPSFESLEGRLAQKAEKKTNWLSLVSKIAAIFIIGLGTFLVLNNDNTLTMATQLAENKNVTLPDNSKVSLNEASSLSYDSEKWEDNRALTLNGEAFFEVEKGQRFDVKTPYGTVSVLGTEFNVTARDSIFEVVCYEGLVEVNYQGQITKLPAGKSLVVKNEKIQEQYIALRKPQWLNQLSVFEDVSLKTVIAELEKQYNIKVINETTDDMRFTGAFENNNLNNALIAITQTLGLSFEINGQNVTLTHGAR